MQQQVILEVEQAKTRSGMPVKISLKILGVAYRSYFRWKKEEAWNAIKSEPIKPVQVYEALPEEKQAVKSYALEHAEIRHRELAWRMLDEDVASLSPSTVYRILLEESLIKRHRGRPKRYRQEHEKASRPDQIWATDLMYLKIGQEQYFIVAFIDEYSRYLVHHEVTTSMDAMTLSTAAQTALQTLPMDAEDRVTIQPIIRSDNGSGYVSREFGELLEHHGLVHHRIRPHCPEENGVMERANRTIREKLDEHEVTCRKEAEEALKAIISNYNNERLHSSLGFKTPATYYRGNPDALDQARRQKLREARHRRKEENLKLKQRNFPFSATEDVA